MDGRTRAALNRRLDQFEAAAKDDAFKGAGHPDDIPSIEQDLIDKRKALIEFFESRI